MNENFSSNLAADIIENSEEVRELRQRNRYLMAEHAAAVELAIGDHAVIEDLREEVQRLRDSHRELVKVARTAAALTDGERGYYMPAKEILAIDAELRAALQRAEELELGQ